MTVVDLLVMLSVWSLFAIAAGLTALALRWWATR